MDLNLSVEWVILGMAVLTYATRVFGYWVSSRFKQLPGSIELGLKYIPGTTIISIIAPSVLASGAVNMVAAAVCLVVAMITRNVVVVMGTGMLTVWGLRFLSGTFIPL